MAGMSSFLEDEILDHTLGVGAYTMPTSIYISVHSASPAGTGANEIASTTRQGDTAFNAASSGATANTSAITFTSMPSATVSHVGIWDAVTSGNFLWEGALSSSVVCGSGDTFEIAAGDLDVTLD